MCGSVTGAHSGKHPTGESAASVALGEGVAAMGLGDKFHNKAEELKGKAKVEIGKATDDPELRAEGHVDQLTANVKQVGEKIKDVFKH